jgi:hypothetical protein
MTAWIKKQTKLLPLVMTNSPTALTERAIGLKIILAEREIELTHD